jgi:hypothetical protein
MSNFTYLLCFVRKLIANLSCLLFFFLDRSMKLCKYKLYYVLLEVQLSFMDVPYNLS